MNPPLPDPFLWSRGSRLTERGQWPARRAEMLRLLLDIAYGALPPVPAVTACELLHTAIVRHMGNARLLSCRITVEGEHAFMLRVFAPAQDAAPAAGEAQARLPVVLSGDGCWHYATDAVITGMLARGYAFAEFNRVEVASDTTGEAYALGARFLRERAPDCRAIAAWAWACHRAVDALLQLPFVDAAAIALVGHSRGGKTALLAGATDERIALVSANNSGAGGAGCYRWQGEGAETLADITVAFPHWFAPGFRDWAGREHELPFDQHFLKALIAPRALLTTEARDDLWANPEGAWQTQRAAAEVYAFLGVPERIAMRYRLGGHPQAADDWTALLDFCDAHLRGRAAAWEEQAPPYAELAPAYGWTRPAVG